MLLTSNVDFEIYDVITSHSYKLDDRLEAQRGRADELYRWHVRYNINFEYCY